MAWTPSTFGSGMLSLTLLFSRAETASIKAMTFNVRYPGSDVGADAWAARKDAVDSTVKRYNPDFLGTQEVVAEYLPFLKQRLSEYAYFGRYRYDDKRRWDEACFLWYKKNRWEVVAGDSGTFQLSYTPEVVGSGDWDVEGRTVGWGNDSRIVTWGRFREIATGKTVYVYNTHWDNQGPDDRPAMLSAQRILARKTITDPVIYMGDLNARQGDPGIDYLLGKRGLSDPVMGKGPDIAMLDTDPGLVKIDHVFILPKTAAVVSAGRKVDLWDVNGYKQIRASDHYPTLAEVKLWPDGSTILGPTRHSRTIAPAEFVLRYENGDILVRSLSKSQPDDVSAVFHLNGRLDIVRPPR